MRRCHLAVELYSFWQVAKLNFTLLMSVEFINADFSGFNLLKAIKNLMSFMVLPNEFASIAYDLFKSKKWADEMVNGINQICDGS